MALVKQCEYDGLYMFKYSKRPGTPAARFAGELPPAEIKERFLTLERLQREIQNRVYANYVGRSVSVLVEGESARSAADVTGHSTCHKVVNFPAPVELLGQVARVRVTQAKSNSLYGEILSAP